MISRFRYLFVCALILLALGSCKRSDITIIKWDGGSSIETLNWWVNDKAMSPGVIGFEQVLQALSRLEDNAHFKVLYPIKFWNDETKGYDLNDPFPFQDRNDLREKMIKLLVDNHLHFTQSSFE